MANAAASAAAKSAAISEGVGCAGDQVASP